MIAPTKVSLPCSNFHQTNMESPWGDTSVFPGGGGGPTRPTEPNVPPPNWNRSEPTNILTDFKQHVEKTKLQTGELVVIEITIYPLFLKTPENQCTWVQNRSNKHQKRDLTTRLSPLLFRPVSLRKATINGHTPTILATTSRSSGIARRPVKMAFFSAGREAIQSRLSAPFSLLTINSVIEYGSKVPKTLAAVF